ncbi:MAG: thermostable hemolysin [Methylophagaceae bacterium]
MDTLPSYRQPQKDNKLFSAPKESLLLPHMPIQFDGPASTNRSSIEQYVADSFNNSYQAKITEFLPYLLSTQSDNKLTATIGFQPAATKQPLFLEQYLSKTIESTLSDLLKKTIPRDQIVEVGNLTSGHQGRASQILFILSVAILHQADFKWVTFTATKQVQTLLKKLNLNTQKVCKANPADLLNSPSSWGNYYDDKPTVLVGNLTDAIEQLNSHKVVQFILQNYHHTVIEIAEQIKLK